MLSVFIQNQHAGKEKTADMRHLGQPVWIHRGSGKTVNSKGLWLCAVKVQEQNQLQLEFFLPSAHDKIIYKWLI